jgi:Ser/Thr protein kinase RdoA (MazF antagonist)
MPSGSAPEDEIPLGGGRTTRGVCRVGDTVRRPRSARSAFVRRLLEHLAARRFAGAPRFLGTDAAGRDVLSFVPGVVPADLGAFSQPQLAAAARLLRALHEATLDCDLTDGHEVVCHGDASPCNCVLVDGLPAAFIDFDAAHPGARADDLGYAAWHWLDIGNDEIAVGDQRHRLAAFFADYGAAGEIEPVTAVLAAQARASGRTGSSAAHQEWVAGCRAWTLRHSRRLLLPSRAP